MAQIRFYKRRWFKVITLIVIVLILIIVVCNLIISLSTRKACFDDTAAIPACHVGLLLGTSPVLNNGNTNLYFKYRIEAAVELYKAGKVNYILVSGDNSRSEYNEPLEMQNALIAGGVPQRAIFLDYAGFRTLDSVVRAKEIFGQTELTIISQKFHNERAIYLARANGISAIGYNARDVSAYNGIKTRVREWLARVKVFVDLLTSKEPKFLGEPITIPPER